jgi:hypothetical protein
VIDITTNVGGFIAWLVAIAMAAATLWLLVLAARWIFEARRQNDDPLRYVMAVSGAGAAVFTLVLVFV